MQLSLILLLISNNSYAYVKARRIKYDHINTIEKDDLLIRRSSNYYARDKGRLSLIFYIFGYM